jgi:hypothetical protein
MSWNTGVDYRHLLAISSERDLVYKAAGLSVEKGLRTLAQGVESRRREDG